MYTNKYYINKCLPNIGRARRISKLSISIINN